MSLTSSRRERNKARTRQALIDAARALAGERGLDSVTADEIADRAGVSRRTFFNYFPSIEAVVAEGLSAPLQRIAEAFLRRPAGEDPLAAVMAALRERPLGEEVLLGWGTVGATVPAGRPDVHQRLWAHHEQWLAGVLRRRLGPDADELRVRTLAAAVMALFETVQRDWLPRAAERDPQEAVTALNRELLRALAHARAGWQHH